VNFIISKTFTEVAEDFKNLFHGFEERRYYEAVTGQGKAFYERLAVQMNLRLR